MQHHATPDEQAAPERFQLDATPEPARRKTDFENNERTRQGRLIIGADDLPGQTYLFDG